MDDLLEEVQRAAGLRARAHAGAALRAVLEALGAMIPHRRRETVADGLPSAAREAFRTLSYDESRDAAWLVERVARQEHVRASFGLEHVEAVLGVVRDALPAATWRILSSELPADVRALVPPVRATALPSERLSRRDGHPRAIAEARPGSAHPLAEAHPGSAHTIASPVDGDE